MAILLVRDPNDPRSVAQTLNEVVKKLNDTTGDVTWTTGISTTVTNAKITPQTVPVLVAFSAAAMGQNYWIDNVVMGSFRINHAAGAANRTFKYVLNGL